MNPYITVVSLPLAFLVVVASGFYETQVLGATAILPLVIGMFFARRDSGYFSAALVATLLYCLVWVVATGGQHAWHEGFDPMRYDWMARSMPPDEVLNEHRNVWVIYPAAVLYSFIGQNIAAIAALNFALIACAVIVLSARYRNGGQEAAPFLIAFLLTPELVYHSGMLAKEPLNFAVLIFFAAPLLDLHERRYSLIGFVALGLGLAIAAFVRVELLLVFAACAAFVLVTSSKRHSLLWSLLVGGTVFAASWSLREQIDQYLELGAEFAELVLDEHGSIDPLKEFIRGATVSASITDRLFIAPVKLLALLFGPLPKASFLDLYAYWQSGADTYALFINLFNKVTACMLLGAAWLWLRRRPTMDGENKVFVIIGAVGILIAALVPPFLHLRYRIPYTPFLLLPLIRDGRTFQLVVVAGMVYGATEAASLLLHFIAWLA